MKEGFEELPQQMGIAQRARHEREAARRAAAQQQEPQDSAASRISAQSIQWFGSDAVGQYAAPADTVTDLQCGASTAPAEELALTQAWFTGTLARPPQTVASEGNQRIVNNVMRHDYRVLSDIEKAQMVRVKDLGMDFLRELHAIGQTDPLGDRQGSRELSIAQTKIEEAVMWAVKHITR